MKFTVKEPAPLLDFLLKATGTTSKTRIRNLLQHGSVVVDGAVQKRAIPPWRRGKPWKWNARKASRPKKLSALPPGCAFPGALRR
jgi:hypothetical protein